VAENSVNLEIGVETREALARLDQFQKTAQNAVGQVEKGFAALKAGVIAAVAALASKEIIDFFADGIKGAVAQQDAMQRLGSAMQLTGDYSAEALKDFGAFADQMESTTKFGDDLIISQLSVAKSFGLSNDKAKDLVKAAGDLASATGVDLETAVQSLGKTLSGTTGKLEKQIPALQGLTKEQLANGDAIKLVAERYGGSASREIDTFGGAVHQVQNGIEDFQKAIGLTIIQNGPLVAAVKLIGKAFNSLQTFVEENSDTLNDFISALVKGLATSVPIALDVLEFFGKGLEGLIGVGELAFTGLLEIVTIFARGWQIEITTVVDVFLGFIETITGSISAIPGLGDALAAIGIDTDKAATSVGELRQGFDDLVDGAVSSIAGVRDASADFAVKTADKFESLNESFDSFKEGVNNATLSILDADDKVKASATDVAQTRKDLLTAPDKSAAELQKLAEEAAKFAEQVKQQSADEIQNLQAKLDAELAKIQEFEDARVISAQEAADLIDQVEQNTYGKIRKIQDERVKKEIEDQQKVFDERKKLVSEAASNPIAVAVSKIDFSRLDRDALADIAPGIAGAAGAANKLLDGKNGAKSAVAEGLGAVGDAILPGIGGAVSGIVSKLAEGPEAVKGFITEFIKGIPDIITNIAEAMPVVVDALIDTLINKGGLVKIATALLKAVVGEALLKNIGKKLGINFGDSLNAKNIGDTMSKGMSKITDKIPSVFKDSFVPIPKVFSAAKDAFIGPLKKLFAGDLKGFIEGAFRAPIDFFRNTLPAPLRAFVDKLEIFKRVPELFQQAFAPISQSVEAFKNAFVVPLQKLFGGDIKGFIEGAFEAPITFFRDSMPKPLKDFVDRISGAFSGFTSFFGSLFQPLVDAFEAFKKDFLGPLQKLFSGDLKGFVVGAFEAPIAFFRDTLGKKWDEIMDKVSAKFDGIGKSFRDKLEIKTPGWLQNFIDAINKLLGFKLPGSSGKLASLNPLDSLPKFASGGVVPSGFPNDGYVARLQSHERVLSPDQTADLHDFLNDYKRGRIGGGGGGPTTVVLKVGEAELSKVLLNLNRQGFRTAV
jgi:hypothetical protein